MISFLTDFALIKLLRVFSIMKEDNFVIGVSSIYSSTINLGKRDWSLSESDNACGRFNFCYFSLGFWFCFVSMGTFAEFTGCAPHPPQSSMKGNALRGKPIRLGKSGLHIQYTHTEETNQQFGISRFSFPRGET